MYILIFLNNKNDLDELYINIIESNDFVFLVL